MKHLLFLFLILLPGLSQARLGEDLGTCMQRYGDIVSSGQPGEPVVFQKSGLIITIWFDSEGHADLITFFKATGDESLSQTEIDHLVQINLPGKKSTEETFEKTLWQTVDQQRIAVFNHDESILSVCTTAGMKRLSDQERSAKIDKLKDF